jgi:hypothetical protein
MNLYRVSYSRWFLDKQQNWDLMDEVDYVHAVSEDNAREYIMQRNSRVSTSHIVVKLLSEEEREALKDYDY